MIEAVVFDWGGTLTPWHDIDLRAQWYAYAEHYDPVGASALAGRLADAEVARWQMQRDSLGAESTGALEALFIAEGIDVTSARHLRALAEYFDFWAPHTIADPQAESLLAGLCADGLRIGVLSNTMWTRRHHEEVLARDGLTPHIHASVFSSELPVAKPHREAFEAIADALGTHPSACAFVGDRLWDDIRGAQDAGMRAIWIPHSSIPGHEVPDSSAVPDAIARELSEVRAIVAAWRTGGDAA